MANPAEVYNMIQLLLQNAKLVTQKKLTCSDVARTHNRLLVRVNQIKLEVFLNEEELGVIGAQESVPVRVIGPGSVESNLQFKKYNLSETAKFYAITHGWGGFVRRTGLQVMDTIQLWSFRVNGNLCFAVAKVEL
uniref:putative B3 domain-containing protein At3g49610 n=1 Tax=Fragaria vesca subsp. vesca TaxID=101020 RepID=UPI0005CABC0C|nr:PREDICTED: putative B3 domain-containing protein At3g49610 [Fragaria vesca subsp. vesca]